LNASQQLGSDTVCAFHRRGSVLTAELHYADEQIYFVSLEHDLVPLPISYASGVRLLEQWGGVPSLVEDPEPGTPAAVGVAILRSGLALQADDHRKK